MPVPSHFKRVVHVRPKMSCRACETIVQAPMPALPIEKGRPGPALLAHVIVSKYCDHLPLHRQSDIYARNGVGIDRSVMAGWVGDMAALLAPLAERIGAHVRAGAAVHEKTQPELNPVENVWQYLRANWLSNRVFETYDAIIDAACEAWRKFTDQQETITSIGMRQWAHVGHGA